MNINHSKETHIHVPGKVHAYPNVNSLENLDRFGQIIYELLYIKIKFQFTQFCLRLIMTNDEMQIGSE